MLTAQKLRELLAYDPETGVFTRIIQRTTGKGGWIGSDGYRYIYVANKTYAAHRLAWFYINEEWPKYDIDHINGIKTDNRIENLRDAPTTVNMQNERKPRKNNPHGFMGVSYRKDRNKWTASIRVDGKSKRLGVFSTPEEAEKAYLEGKRLYHAGFML